MNIRAGIIQGLRDYIDTTILSADVTDELLDQFRRLFKTGLENEGLEALEVDELFNRDLPLLVTVRACFDTFASAAKRDRAKGKLLGELKLGVRPDDIRDFLSDASTMLPAMPREAASLSTAKVLDISPEPEPEPEPSDQDTVPPVPNVAAKVDPQTAPTVVPPLEESKGPKKNVSGSRRVTCLAVATVLTGVVGIGGVTVVGTVLYNLPTTNEPEPVEEPQLSNNVVVEPPSEPEPEPIVELEPVTMADIPKHSGPTPADFEFTHDQAPEAIHLTAKQNTAAAVLAWKCDDSKVEWIERFPDLGIEKLFASTGDTPCTDDSKEALATARKFDLCVKEDGVWTRSTHFDMEHALIEACEAIGDGSQFHLMDQPFVLQ